MISTRLHGILDYVSALILIALPWMTGVEGRNPETAVPVSLGVATIIYSLCTNYEFGAFRLLPMNTHLILDLANAVILSASPVLFGFIDNIYLPYLIVGLVELVIIVLSSLQRKVSSS